MKSNLSAEFFFENMDVSFFVLDEQDRIIKVNKSTENLFKKNQKEFFHKKFQSFVNNFNIDNIQKEVISKKLKIIKRNLFVNIDENKKTDVSISISPVFNKEQHFIGSIITCMDISGEIALISQLSEAEEEFKKRTSQMAEERDKFHLVIESISDGVVVIDETYNITLFNSSIRKIIRVSSKQLMNTHLKKHFKEIFYSELIRKKKYFQSEEIEVFIKKDNSKKILMVHLAPLITQRGKGLNMVLTIRDITKQKQIDEMKTQFVSNVSHELRTPLSSIKGFAATLLARKDLSKEQKNKFLNIIDSESDRLTRLIEDLLSLSRIESSSFALRISEFDLIVIIEKVKQEFESLLKKKSLNLQIVSASIPDMIADKDKIFQLLLNLVNNSIKFTKENTSIVIKVSFKKNNKCFIISIKDEGPGISIENLEKIFDKFFRVEDRVHTISGTGLGLSIVKTIIQKHNGDINVKSRVGKGTSFIVTIPQGVICDGA